MFVPPVALIRRKRIVEKLLMAGAVTPETAKTPEEAGVFQGAGFIISRLAAHGRLIKVEKNRYYVPVKRN